MSIIEIIKSRRSIRRFRPDPIEQKVIENLLELATHSPSAKNAQPWRFVVMTGEAKTRLLEQVNNVLQKALSSGRPTGSLRGSLRAMEEAPTLILVFNGESRAGLSIKYEYAKSLVDTQSLGAAIQTMLLAAHSIGLGALWVCDVLYAAEEISAFVGRTDELVAAVAIGTPAESPVARPRREWGEVTVFMERL